MAASKRAGKKGAKRYLRLEEAADKLQARGIATGRDYHALSTDDKLLLNEVMGQTMWRQAPSSAAAGRSRSYSFWQAVSRYWGPGPRRRRATSVSIVRGREAKERSGARGFGEEGRKGFLMALLRNDYPYTWQELQRKMKAGGYPVTLPVLKRVHAEVVSDRAGDAGR